MTAWFMAVFLSTSARGRHSGGALSPLQRTARPDFDTRADFAGCSRACWRVKAGREAAPRFIPPGSGAARPASFGRLTAHDRGTVASFKSTGRGALLAPAHLMSRAFWPNAEQDVSAS